MLVFSFFSPLAGAMSLTRSDLFVLSQLTTYRRGSTSVVCSSV